jgi:hypothetical protein
VTSAIMENRTCQLAVQDSGAIAWQPLGVVSSTYNAAPELPWYDPHCPSSCGMGMTVLALTIVISVSHILNSLRM